MEEAGGSTLAVLRVHPGLSALVQASHTAQEGSEGVQLVNGKRAGSDVAEDAQKKRRTEGVPVLDFNVFLAAEGAEGSVTDLGEVELIHVKPIKVPKEKRQIHTIQILTPDSRLSTSSTPLLDLFPYDEADTLAARLKAAHSDGWVAQGEGSVLDALITLAKSGLVTLSSSLSTSMSSGYSLAVKVELLPCFFGAKAKETVAKRILVRKLFPPTVTQLDEPLSTPAFYHALQRSPRTVGGLSVRALGRPRDDDEEAKMEVEFDDAAAARRKEKGKGRAVDESTASKRLPEAGHEDLILRPPGLTATLIPFQSRTVRWLLSREGKWVPPPSSTAKEADERELDDETPEPEDDPLAEDLPHEELQRVTRGPLWESVDCKLDGRKFWLNRSTSELSLEDPVAQRQAEGYMLGSLLSEEVGLGKTLEVIALILLNRDEGRNDLESYFDEGLNTTVQPTGMTLIVTPASIIEQWASELARHAPSLRVLRYESLSGLKGKKWTTAYIKDNYDIVLSSYDGLKREVAIARKPVERNLRSGVERNYRRSLFVSLEFLRVVQDEVQLVGDGSLTSETVALIPRVYSLAVSGTPLERMSDLRSLLKFLRFAPICETPSGFSRLIHDPSLFSLVVSTLGERTTKDEVEDQLSIPLQTRLLVPVEFGKVERYWYDTRYADCLEDLGVGDRVEDDFQLDKVVMNRCLTLLRKLCCHPQGVGKARLPVAGDRGGKVQTVSQVLSQMVETASAEHQSLARERFALVVKMAQLTTFDRENCERFEDALVLLQKVAQEIQPMTEVIEAALRAAWELQRAEAARQSRSMSVASTSSFGDKRTNDALTLGFEGDVSRPAAVPLSARETELALKTSALRNRLRELLAIQHQAYFLQGSCHFSMGRPVDAAAETKAYDQATSLRNVMHRPYELRCDSSALRLKKQIEQRDLAMDDLRFEFVPEKGEVYEDIAATVEALNQYALLIASYRDKCVAIIEMSVSVSSEDKGDEYEEAAVRQEELDVYLEALGLVLSQWRFALTGERSALAEQDAFAPLNAKKDVWAASDGSRRNRLSKKEKQKNLVRPSLERGDAPADIIRFDLHIELERAKGENVEELVPMRRLLQQVDDAELRVELATKEKLCDRLRSELSDITKAHNVRLEYYVALQVTSDEVADPVRNPKKNFHEQLGGMETELVELDTSIRRKVTTIRYLTTLKEEEGGPVDRECVICACPYENGILTRCGHIFCEGCFLGWRKIRATCPICKTLLEAGHWKKTTFTSKEEPKPVEAVFDDSAKHSTIEVEVPPLNYVDREVLNLITSIGTQSALSAKSTAIVKHCRLIRSRDPLAKLVIFSTWTDSLAILMEAFDRDGGIEYARLEGGGRAGKSAAIKRFVSDPECAVFLLHTKSQSAGLNLTAASYVILMEPLFHASLETQAVARVHRIGQTRRTQVFQYLVSDTVDQRIAELRARNGTSLFMDSGRLVGLGEEGKISEESNVDQDDIASVLFDPATTSRLQHALIGGRPPQ